MDRVWRSKSTLEPKLFAKGVVMPKTPAQTPPK